MTAGPSHEDNDTPENGWLRFSKTPRRSKPIVGDFGEAVKCFVQNHYKTFTLSATDIGSGKTNIQNGVLCLVRNTGFSVL